MVSRRRVVVTGLGVVSSIGIGKDEFWKNLTEGRSGISKVERFDTSQFDVHIGGEIKSFSPEKYFDEEQLEKFGRGAQFAIAATKLALSDAQLTTGSFNGSPVSLCLGTTMAEAQALEAIDDRIVRFGGQPKAMTRKLALQYPSNMIAVNVAKFFGFGGKVLMIPTACAAANYCVSYGSDLIRLGKSEIVVVGGVDPFSRTAFTGFNRIFALAPERCQPFDLKRQGIVVGEGAGILVLESLEHAIDRGATIYAEITGYGTSCDAHHMTIPSMDGVIKVMEDALDNAEISHRDVDYISAHGTGTPVNDRTECAAILRVFGDRGHKIPVSSIKSMLGHTMGAASALEAIACALAVYWDRVPPTINYETPDPECLIDCVPNRARNARVNVALNNSFAFGGNNACVVFEKYELQKN